MAPSTTSFVPVHRRSRFYPAIHLNTPYEGVLPNSAKPTFSKPARLTFVPWHTARNFFPDSLLSAACQAQGYPMDSFTTNRQRESIQPPTLYFDDIKGSHFWTRKVFPIWGSSETVQECEEREARELQEKKDQGQRTAYSSGSKRGREEEHQPAQQHKKIRNDDEDVVFQKEVVIVESSEDEDADEEEDKDNESQSSSGPLDTTEDEEDEGNVEQLALPPPQE